MVNLGLFFIMNMGIMFEEKLLVISGRNWGDVILEGSFLVFSVGGKYVFDVFIVDVL